jgi:hypothetical protein
MGAIPVLMSVVTSGGVSWISPPAAWAGKNDTAAVESGRPGRYHIGTTRYARDRTRSGFAAGNKLIWGTTVLDNDTAAATLTGGLGQDWFFANLGPGGIIDTITDRQPGEQVN